jgi:RimJ/RimL family protein N-acetyltransferase
MAREWDAEAYEWGETLPTLTASRVALRSLREGDAPALLEVFGDPEVARYWSSPPWTGLDAAARLVAETHERLRARTLFQWGVARRGDDVVIGTCTLLRPEPRHRRAEIGFALGRRSWGRGLGSEAVATLIGFAFGPLSLHRLEADVDPRNGRSLRLLERAGFRREGLLRERYHVAGEIQDTVFLGLLRREWRERSLPEGGP